MGEVGDSARGGSGSWRSEWREGVGSPAETGEDGYRWVLWFLIAVKYT